LPSFRFFPYLRPTASILGILALACALTGCPELNPRTVPTERNRPTWNGSPFIEWEVSTFLNPLLTWQVLSEGIMVYEGAIREGRFDPEKAVLLDFSGDKVIWRKALSPRLSPDEPVFAARTFYLPAAPARPPQFVTWVRGDVLRAQNVLTGEDTWNRPGCRLPLLHQDRIAAVCFDRLTLIEPETGQIVTSQTLGFRPTGLWTLGEHFILRDTEDNLHYLRLSGGQLPAIPTPGRLTHVFVRNGRLLLLSRHREGHVLQSLSVSGQRWVLDWKTELNQVPNGFWIHGFQELIIFPIGFDCISARGLEKGDEAWISCGIDPMNPPAWDEDGVFLLSSRVENGHRPVIYVDGYNGLQTPLFRNTDDANIVPIMAMTIAPGQILHGVLHGVHSTSRLFALRVAAPAVKEKP
jgi:hypothetical protein